MTKIIRLHPALIAALIAALGLPVNAQDAPPPKPHQAETPADAPAQPDTGTPGTTVGQPAPAPLTRGLAGPYLSARMAASENDFRAAARYFLRAVQQDPDDPYLQDSALVSLISAGDMDRAVELSQQINESGAPTQLSALMQRAQLAKAGDWDALLALLDSDPSDDGDPQGARLLDGMTRAWALMGAGRATEALSEFEELSRLRGAEGMVQYQLALARALVGDYDGADKLLANGAVASHLMGITATAQVLAQLDRRDEAIAMLDATEGLEAEPGLQALRAQLAAGLPVTFDIVRNPSDGIAQVYMIFATILSASPEPDPLALIHARMAAWLEPDLSEARLLVAQLLQQHGQFDLAEQEFEAMRDLGAVRPAAELSRIDALTRADRMADAERAALALTAAYPDLHQPWIALGDLLRQQKKFPAAVPAYDKALALLKDAPGEQRWFPLYARGIALERSGQFDRAEADFLAAIDIRPNDAGLLNYLGYSWIDRNEKLDDGLALIRKAVDLSPDDGYIQDSLAWAYFRMGQYDKALAPMEKAIGSMSSDPIVNDHLGDIYWMVGRKREAEIQWHRALSLKPEPGDDIDPDRIRAKLERGLDAIMAEEKAKSAPAGQDQPAN